MNVLETSINRNPMADVIRIYRDSPNPKQIARVVEVLRKGGIIIYPTDTVYGLGCDITNTRALERIAKIKGKKLGQANLSFICEDLSDIASYTRQLDSSQFKLLKRNLPGPFTFVLNGSNSLPTAFKKRKTVGIRVPDDAIAIELVRQLGNPIVSTSIKDEDEVIEYTTDPSLIAEKWDNRVDLIVDAGYGGNIASTVVDLTTDEPEIIREGKGELDL